MRGGPHAIECLHHGKRAPGAHQRALGALSWALQTAPGRASGAFSAFSRGARYCQRAGAHLTHTSHSVPLIFHSPIPASVPQKRHRVLISPPAPFFRGQTTPHQKEPPGRPQSHRGARKAMPVRLKAPQERTRQAGRVTVARRAGTSPPTRRRGATGKVCPTRSKGSPRILRRSHRETSRPSPRLSPAQPGKAQWTSRQAP